MRPPRIGFVIALMIAIIAYLVFCMFFMRLA